MLMLAEKRSFILGLSIGIAAATCVFLLYSIAGRQERQADAADSKAPPLQGAHETSRPMQLTPSDKTRIGLQTAQIRRETIIAEIQAPGWVEEIEGAVHTVASPFSGKIDRLLVSQPGEVVKKGQTIALVESGDMAAAVQDYKVALQNQREFAAAHRPELLARANSVAAATEKKLAQLGLTEAQIKNIEALPEKDLRAHVVSDADAILRTKNVTEGRFVGAGEVIASLTDLGRVWVKASVFESDIGQIHPGMSVQITSDALAGTTLHGMFKVVEPRADTQTRTVPVRIEVPNPGMRLRPGMFARATFEVPQGKNVLAVPRTAVIDTGAGTIVYVESSGGFQRRKIRLGAATKDLYAVVEGLSEGETVVTEGAFLLESQARLTSDVQTAEDSPLSDSTAASRYAIKLQISPDPPNLQNDLSVSVRVLDDRGDPVKDLDVKLNLSMPAMPSMGMPEMRKQMDLSRDGTDYRGRLRPPMAGHWTVGVEAYRDGRLMASSQTGLNVQ
jgi:membrane fusion protein, copper/silver efflux system